MDSKLSEASDSRQQLESVHAKLHDLLESLDKAELHGAAAYVSMALDWLQRDYPDLNGSR